MRFHSGKAYVAALYHATNSTCIIEDDTIVCLTLFQDIAPPTTKKHIFI